MNKPLRPGIFPLQRIGATLNQSEEFSVRDLTDILLVFAFGTVSCATGLLLYTLDAAAYKCSLVWVLPGCLVFHIAGHQLPPAMRRIRVPCGLIKRSPFTITSCFCFQIKIQFSLHEKKKFSF